MATRDSGGGQQRQTRRTNEAEETAPEASDGDAVAERKEKLDDDVDAILDEIDEVLESNAEDFVRSFVQKGGQ
jgi:ubiquitin-like protein Pup